MTPITMDISTPIEQQQQQQTTSNNSNINKDNEKNSNNKKKKIKTMAQKQLGQYQKYDDT